MPTYPHRWVHVILKGQAVAALLALRPILWAEPPTEVDHDARGDRADELFGLAAEALAWASPYAPGTRNPRPLCRNTQAGTLMISSSQISPRNRLYCSARNLSARRPAGSVDVVDT